MLNTCNEHKEAVVVHEGYKCPVCEALKSRDDEIEGYKEEENGYLVRIKELEAEVKDLNDMLADSTEKPA